MKANILLKLTSLISVISGLLLIIGWTLNIGRDNLTGAIMVTTGYTLSILAYIGIFNRQFKTTNTLALVGLIFLILGHALFISFGFLDVARLSGLTPEVDWLLVQSQGPTYIFGAIGGVSFMLGYFLFGLAVYQNPALWTWIAIAFLLASIMPLLHSFIGMGKMLIRIGSLALIGLGVNIWNQNIK